MVEPEREAEIRLMTRKALLYELREARAGHSEAVFKEAWSNCNTREEIEISDSEIDRLIEAVEALGRRS